MRHGLKLYALEEGAAFAGRVAGALGVEVEPVEERRFEDGEVKVRPLRDPRGADVFLVQSLDGGLEGGVHDRLMRILMLAGALKDAGAERLTGVFPYLAYARKDRRTKAFDPLTLRYVARMMEAVGIDRVMALDVHSRAAFENAFRVPTLPLDPHQLYIDRLAVDLAGQEVVVVSPDPGGLKRVQLFQERLEAVHERVAGRAIVDKRRSAGVVSGELVVGEVRGAVPLVIDDLTSSGGTLARAAEALIAAGSEPAIVAVAHGVFAREAATKLRTPSIARVLVTDSIDPPRLDGEALPSLEIVGCAPLFADAIRAVHEGLPFAPQPFK